MSAIAAKSPTAGGLLTEIELLLRNRFRFFAEVRDGVDLPRKIWAMVAWAAAFLAVTGAIIGSTHSVWQALASAAKLPLLFLITLLVCLPTLYFFNTIFESSLSLGQNLALILSAVTVTAIVLLAFMPVVLFFMITTSQYQFFKLLNVGIFSISGVVGLLYLLQGMRLVSARDRRGVDARAWVLRLWIVLYGFVGSQLAWTLRPFFGAPESSFELFRGFGGNFYTNILASLGEVLGFFTVR
jgi:hypothetical protein